MADCPEENVRPMLSQETVECILQEQYDIPREIIDVIDPLVSYDDQNFYVKLKPDSRELVLKITNWRDSKNIMLIGEMTELMFRLGKSVPCSAPRHTKAGSLLGRCTYSENGNTRECIVRLFDFLPGNATFLLQIKKISVDDVADDVATMSLLWSRVGQKSQRHASLSVLRETASAFHSSVSGKIINPGEATPAQAFQWGALLGRMHLAFESMIFPTINERSFLWSWEGVPKVSRYLDAVSDNSDREFVRTIFDKYERQMMPRMQRMKRDLLHGDMNERNILINSAGEVYAVLDFADAQGGPRVWDLALVLAYLSLILPDTERDLVPYFGQAIAGYAQYMPDVLRETGDVETLKTLICTRLCQSLVLGLQSFKTKADPYVLTSQKRGWPALKMLYYEPRESILDAWNKLLTPFGVEIKKTAN
ncbi:aminoglycoside phosphotransferase domain-containing protein 1-like [Tropilaelaps mercedesae]|uniref:Hydroxylysine kinase n=1 Tax=Tropilaelaps mercedesae TaxID=418985 RepID=A0A1V9X5P7_9ACAR|nr:aminoglycoside phosphotransferase domain-containing protein 1-like [Tropilaelaps mercedesae]